MSLNVDRYFTDGKDVYDIPTRSVDIEIRDSKKIIKFKQNGVEVPNDWSENAASVVASKYFKDKIDGANEREYSVKQLVRRVVDTIVEQGVKQNYFDENSSKIFSDELAFLMLHQHASFNSPVWFNVGLHKKYGFSEIKDEKFHFAYNFEKDSFTNNVDIYERPQLSACFISQIKDNMGSIMDICKREAMIFKWGSGNGINFKLRGYHEPLSHGGKASGVMYFDIGYDHWAKIIKSGGKTRRAAKMVIMDIDHPDIFKFVEWKGNEELKAKALQVFKKYAPIDSNDLDDEAHFSVSGQNSNNSVRITDKFMMAYRDDADWDLNFITGRNREDILEEVFPMDDYDDDRYFSDKKFFSSWTNKRKITKARTLMDVIAKEALNTGDPGVQFDDTINEWHTCKNSGRINASNPCSEYMFLDDSSCNLASIRLTKYLDKNGNFDVEGFKHSVQLIITAQEILVDFASYPGPDESIARNSHEFRPLGLGYADLGALLMNQGIAYDSDDGMAIASSITSLMTATAYNQSARIANVKGPFKKFEENKQPFMDVMKKHRKSTTNIKNNSLENVLSAAKEEWDSVLKQNIFRNAQTTLLAPTGTIGFMMDVDTTGVEPLMGLTVQKNLSGGGRLVLTNHSVENGLKKLGYSDEQILDIKDYITNNQNIDESTLHIKKEHLNIFATSLGNNKINYHGHIGMVAAVQPFLSGAISKTVNLPRGSSVDDVKNAYIEAWQRGLKSIALYVDGSKGNQPLHVGEKIKGSEFKWGERKKLPFDIDSFKTTVRVTPVMGSNGTPLHFHFGEDPETGMPMEFFVSFGGAGSDYSNVYDSFFKSMSRAVQHGQPLEKLVKDHIGASGAIKGFTSHRYIKKCTSIEDLWAKLLAGHYLLDTKSWDIQPNGESLRVNVLKRRKLFERAEREIHPEYYKDEEKEITSSSKESLEFSGRICSCGTVMIPKGTCFSCPNCYNDTGCG